MTGRQEPPHHGPESDDRVPEALERAWRELDVPEPPALVDQGVLNRARSAVDRPRTGRPWSFGWAHTLTTAAVITLGLTLLLQLREEAPAPGAAPPDAPPFAEGQPPPSEAEPQSEMKSRSLSKEAEPATAEEAESRPDNPVRLVPLREAVTADAPRAERARSTAEDVANRSPEQWLEDIRALVEAGRIEEARASLADFRDAWPDYPVPDDLLP